MKTSFKTKLALVVAIAGLAVSCKKTETVPAETTYDADTTAVATDTMQTTMDTTATTIDTTATPAPAK
ncbi:hypothetical protein EV144_103311 [Flavobacterium sp. 270]|uniref:hypothetical protein n=1 Tax=Flavobacterium sp. 270 TaxID=2512114 RepID=UPI001064A628|nr:hypothetical protein [Flavobacterium sp. 270]TDW48794.1 hypothetical protein EV144_103311 [Flavobacterium sp. 270]